MKVIYECGYDGNECSNYRVELDGDGNVKEKEIKCRFCGEDGKQVWCDRCHFLGEPWARVVMK